MEKTLEEILVEGRKPDEIIADLKTKELVIPAWSDLEKEYNPKKHPIMVDPSYVDILRADGKTEKVTRVAVPLQKLAAARITQMCFGLPVKRVYKPKDDNEKKVAVILEKIFLKNRINSVNIDRGVKLFASCESATFWYAVEKDNNFYGEQSKLKLRCKSYSPMNGDAIYPLFDEDDDMIALSLNYTRVTGTLTVEYFDVFTNTKHHQWKRKLTDNVWTESVNEKITLTKIPAVYIYRSKPIWEDSNNDVYEIEWTLSRNGNYIRKNSKPLFVIFSDEETQIGKEQPNEGKAVLQYPKGSEAKYVTWEQATESIKFQIESLFRTFFTGLQLPDMSFDSMKTAPMSGEARKMMFIDAQMKVLQEQGAWLEMFDREVNVVKEYMKIMFPKYANAIDSLLVENIITPFVISDEKETINNIMTATGGAPVLSQREGVEYLGWSEDVEKTMGELKSEKTADVMNPTE